MSDNAEQTQRSESQEGETDRIIQIIPAMG